MGLDYPLFRLEVTTPTVRLLPATDDRLGDLIDVVGRGVVADDEAPFDDPMSLYDESPRREWRWLRAIWAARARVEPDWWRLCFVVEVDGRLVGAQDLIAAEFPSYGGITTFSWLDPAVRGRGIGAEMRAAILHLAFDGLGAREATSEAFVDNTASNAVSQALGYEPNGVDWAMRRGRAAQLQRWRLTKDRWEPKRRDDIVVANLAECLPVLGLG